MNTIIYIHHWSAIGVLKISLSQILSRLVRWWRAAGIQPSQQIEVGSKCVPYCVFLMSLVFWPIMNQICEIWCWIEVILDQISVQNLWETIILYSEDVFLPVFDEIMLIWILFNIWVLMYGHSLLIIDIIDHSSIVFALSPECSFLDTINLFSISTPFALVFIIVGNLVTSIVWVVVYWDLGHLGIALGFWFGVLTFKWIERLCNIFQSLIHTDQLALLEVVNTFDLTIYLRDEILLRNIFTYLQELFVIQIQFICPGVKFVGFAVLTFQWVVLWMSISWLIAGFDLVLMIKVLLINIILRFIIHNSRIQNLTNNSSWMIILIPFTSLLLHLVPEVISRAPLNHILIIKTGTYLFIWLCIFQRGLLSVMVSISIWVLPIIHCLLIWIHLIGVEWIGM